MSEDIVTIAEFHSLQTAYFARSLLEAHGIEVFLTNEHATRVMMHPQLSGGIGMQIASEDIESAREVLASMETEVDSDIDLPAPTVDQTGPMCPQCGGARSEPAMSFGLILLSLILLGLPLLFLSGRRRCGFCGRVFRPGPE